MCCVEICAAVDIHLDHGRNSAISPVGRADGT